MSRSKKMLRTWVAGLLVAGVGLSQLACAPPGRPAKVPPDAVYIPLAKGYIWQHCAYDGGRGLDLCSVYQSDGKVFCSEVFVPYDGGPPVAQRDLQIVEHDRKRDVYADFDRVCLKNDRILIPLSRKEDLTRFLDELTGKRKARP